MLICHWTLVSKEELAESEYCPGNLNSIWKGRSQGEQRGHESPIIIQGTEQVLSAKANLWEESSPHCCSEILKPRRAYKSHSWGTRTEKSQRVNANNRWQICAPRYRDMEHWKAGVWRKTSRTLHASQSNSILSPYHQLSLIPSAPTYGISGVSSRYLSRLSDFKDLPFLITSFLL